nr:hypothetical protein [Pseudomonadota bacterium]
LGFLIPAFAHEQPKMWRPPIAQQPTLFLLLWADIIALFFWPSNSMLAPYVLPIYPPLAIIIARYFNWAIDHPRHWGVRCGIIVFGVTSAILIGAGVMHFGSDHPLMNLSLSLLILTTLLSFWLIWCFSFTQTIVVLTIAISVFFISLKLSYPQTDKRTIKELALILKPLLNDNEPVYTYWDYYQDLPVYLNQPVTIVQYYGELQHGITQGSSEKAWVPLEVFWQRWYHPTRQYMIMSLTTFAEAKQSHPDVKFVELGRTERNILVTNLDQ